CVIRDPALEARHDNRPDMTDRALRLVAAAGWLPAGFWLVYAVWNTVLPAPPAFGPFTAINVFYLAMVPAALVSVLNWRQCRWPGRVPYGLFLGWVVVGFAWYDPAHEIEVVKQVL